MKVFITGIEGYIGSFLAKILINKGYLVTGIDTGYFTDNVATKNRLPYIVRKDIRQIKESDLNGFDVVVHLADLSNDPLSEIDEWVTRDINFEGALAVANMTKKAGVSRFIYSSSCSVYGDHPNAPATETALTKPQSMYARCKLDVEKELIKLAGDNFSPLILRNATVYGVSPQMRYDLVVNKFSAEAFLYRKITIDNGGNMWRPTIHISDLCRAIICFIEAQKELIHNKIYNIGNKNDNRTIYEIGKMVQEEFPECELFLTKTSSPDLRSYQVSFEKLSNKFSEFLCEYSVRTGIRELHNYFRESGLTAETYAKPQFTRLKQIKYLLQSKLLDKHFYWINTIEEKKTI